MKMLVYLTHIVIGLETYDGGSIFFNRYFLLWLSHQPRKLGCFLDLEQYFPVQIQKTVIILLLRNVLTSR